MGDLSSHQNALLTDTNKMEQAAEAFGLSKGELGDKYKAGTSAQGLGQASDNFKIIEDSGLDATRIVNLLLANAGKFEKDNETGDIADSDGRIKMSKLEELLDMIKRSVRFQTKIPEEMRRLVNRLAEVSVEPFESEAVANLFKHKKTGENKETIIDFNEVEYEETMSQKMDAIKETMGTKMDEFKDIASLRMSEIATSIEFSITTVMATVTSSMTSVREVVDSLKLSIEAEIRTRIDAIQDIAEARISAIKSQIEGMMAAIRSEVEARMARVQEKIDARIKEIKDIVGLMLERLVAEVTRIMMEIKEEIQTENEPESEIR